MIPNYTIYSDKVFLTANYYIEYLGFNLLYRYYDEESPYVWIELNNQYLLIWPWSKKLGIPKPVEFQLPNIQEYFESLLEKVKIDKLIHLNNNGIKCFSILDCEENLVLFTESPYLQENSSMNKSLADISFESLL